MVSSYNSKPKKFKSRTTSCSNLNPGENKKFGNKYIDSIDHPSSKFSFKGSAASLALAAVMSFNQPVTA